MDELDFIVRSGPGRTVRECLDDARKSTSPQETVQHLFLAVAYQQQQIEELEIAQADAAVAREKAREGIRARAMQTLQRRMLG